MKKLCMLLVCALLAGCGLREEPLEIGGGEPGFVAGVADKGGSVLIGSTYYKITKRSRIQDMRGRVLDADDLEAGMKVRAWYRGDVSKSFPAKTEARLIQVLTDEESKRESAAAAAAIDYVRKNESQLFMVLQCSYIIGADVYDLEIMNRSNLDDSFNIMVDGESHDILDQH